MLQGEYLGMRLTIEDVDKENLAFFHYCAQGDFRLQKGKRSGLLQILGALSTGHNDARCIIRLYAAVEQM